MRVRRSARYCARVSCGVRETSRAAICEAEEYSAVPSGMLRESVIGDKRAWL
jgi:hypothetical protein